MTYTYQYTKDFDISLDWVLQNQLNDNVFFRFTFESYRTLYRTPWMSPCQCLDYMRYFRVDDRFKFFTMRVCA